MTFPAASVVPPEPAEIAMASVGWRRVGVLQRLVKTKAETASLAVDESRFVRRERVQRRAA
jgi:hypothetical protein